MIFYGLMAALTIALGCLVSNKEEENEIDLWKRNRMITRRQGINFLSLLSVFTVLFLPAALRLEVGNDYESYVDTIHEIYVGGYVVTEPLFNWVVKFLCECSGGENYLLVFAFFSFVTLWIFLKVMYEQTEEFPLTFYLFMTLGIYFRTYNTMRYYFVLAMAMFSLRYILRKEYGKFLLFIIFSAFFHKSVLVVIPLYFIALLPWKKWFVGLIILGSAAVFIFQDLFLKLALILYPSYQNTVFLQTESGLGENILTILRCVAVLVFCLLFYREGIKEERENLFYFKLNLLALCLYVCASFLPLVGRIGYYLITPQIFLIPRLLGKIKEEKKKKVWLILILLVGAVYFLLFLRSAHEPGVRVLPYKSWLFYEKEFLNAETIF